MSRALDAIRPSLQSSDLAWLATQEDVESRLVISHGDAGETQYEVRHGPFRDDDLSSLPQQNWTLLVQDVEKHLPDFRALLNTTDFIPDWRIDDLMVSFAAPGGSVGPHCDHYDVFLCQGDGEREWYRGNEDEVIVDASSGDLSLLQPFDDPNPQTAADGDILYLPPGVPHWGIARDFCMTYSIGMRAPNLAELNAAAARLFDASGVPPENSMPAGTDVFYEDPDLTADEAAAGLISDAAVRRTKNLLPVSAPRHDAQIAMILGAAVTDPKAWLAPECISDDEAGKIIESLGRDKTLSVHGMARIAFYGSGSSGLIFANGQARETEPAALQLFRDICRDRIATPEILCADEAAALVRWLLTNGVFDLTGRPD